jgi:hypothetical protein
MYLPVYVYPSCAVLVLPTTTFSQNLSAVHHLILG